MPESLEKLAVVPEPGDNCAVAVADIPAGTQVVIGGEIVRLPHLVMEGHRFVIAPIPAGGPLTSWLTPFATAVRDLSPGDYVCTDQSLALLKDRGVEGLPEVASAANVPLDPYQLDESALVIGEQVPPVEQPATFLGYDRGDGRVGTRNHVVICGVTSRGASFATALAKRFAGRETEGFDGVVALAHTEAGEDTAPTTPSSCCRCWPVRSAIPTWPRSCWWTPRAPP
ncbi:UxaA family hydrolase [Enemella evansiae]|uniref:UxaA family hydrolase n=1 Tax=Enemella evansiae TaxID=2016499 RepID=UPI002B4BD6A0|nr:UxaA family hydrolase [Enemella evansiae]